MTPPIIARPGAADATGYGFRIWSAGTPQSSSGAKVPRSRAPLGFPGRDGRSAIQATRLCPAQYNLCLLLNESILPSGAGLVGADAIGCGPDATTIAEARRLLGRLRVGNRDR